MMTIVLGSLGIRLGYSRRGILSSFLTLFQVNKSGWRWVAALWGAIFLDTSVIIDTAELLIFVKQGLWRHFGYPGSCPRSYGISQIPLICWSTQPWQKRGSIYSQQNQRARVKVMIYRRRLWEINGVDGKLVRLAKVLHGRWLQWFQLKWLWIAGCLHYWISTAANAVKPVDAAERRILVQVIKDGKEYGQGVALFRRWDRNELWWKAAAVRWAPPWKLWWLVSCRHLLAGMIFLPNQRVLEKAQ